MSTMEQSGQKEPNRKRKCGPRVKTGCITCRIRRVKCDEGKPACHKCTSTGRKCDGYVQRATGKALTSPISDTANNFAMSLNMVHTMPFYMPGSQRDRQLFHFYCVQSAFDLSVYLNSTFWSNMIIQYSEQNPVVRQAVIAFGASHVYALNMNQKQHPTGDENSETYEQARQYDKALRALRQHIESSDKPDPQVILICCALFFSCENGRGNREAALKHLQNGLQILNTARQKQIANQSVQPSADKLKSDPTAMYESVANKLRSRDTEVDDELLYVFSRLDCQATLCQEDRVPLLDLETFGESIAGPNTRFSGITDAQRRLDALHSRLAKFLTEAPHLREQPMELLPAWVMERKLELDRACMHWADAMNNFIANQNPTVRKILVQERGGPERKEAEWQLAIQIQLLVLHHRCWWMLSLSSYPNDPTVFTASPNPRAEEILDICEFLGFSLPLKPSVSMSMTDADVAWKLISEVGVTAPLFVLAAKCTDLSVRERAMRQLTALRQHRTGIYEQTFISKVFENLEKPTGRSGDSFVMASDLEYAFESSETSMSPEQEDAYRSPMTVSDSASSEYTRATTVDPVLQGSLVLGPNSDSQSEQRELLGWSRRLSSS